MQQKRLKTGEARFAWVEEIMEPTPRGGAGASVEVEGAGPAQDGKQKGDGKDRGAGPAAAAASASTSLASRVANLRSGAHKAPAKVAEKAGKKSRKANGSHRGKRERRNF